jgi:hypothetical protein
MVATAAAPVASVAPVTPTATRQAAAATPTSPVTAADAAEASDAAWVGDYASDDLGVTYRVQRLADGRLALSWPRRAPAPLVPVAGEPGHYRVAGGYDVRFERADASVAPVLVLTVPRAGEMRMVRVANASQRSPARDE